MSEADIESGDKLNNKEERFVPAVADDARSIARVQASSAMAAMRPRNQVLAMDRIINACTRPSLAERAVYTFARGGTNITGASIHLAKAISQQWGNIRFGIREVGQQNGKSLMQAYAIDIETNVESEIEFIVPHVRNTKRGSYKLEDPRDIYELVANLGARRQRACILSVIPEDVVDAAVEQCELTMKAAADTSPEATKKMLTAFEAFGISRAQIEHRLQRRLDAIQPAQLISLKKIYTSLRDGMSVPIDWFEVGQLKPGMTDEHQNAILEACAKRGVGIEDILSIINEKSIGDIEDSRFDRLIELIDTQGAKNKNE